MRASFTIDETSVNKESQTFLADTNMKEWLQTPEAGAALLSIVRRYAYNMPGQQLISKILNPPAGVAGDSEWFYA